MSGNTIPKGGLSPKLPDIKKSNEVSWVDALDVNLKKLLEGRPDLRERFDKAEKARQDENYKLYRELADSLFDEVLQASPDIDNIFQNLVVEVEPVEQSNDLPPAIVDISSSIFASVLIEEQEVTDDLFSRLEENLDTPLSNDDKQILLTLLEKEDPYLVDLINKNPNSRFVAELSKALDQELKPFKDVFQKLRETEK